MKQVRNDEGRSDPGQVGPFSLEKGSGAVRKITEDS